MASVTCPDCTRAASTWNWHGYRNGCPDCEIRAFASGPFEQWQTAYDQFLKARGREAADEIERRAEDARLAAKTRETLRARGLWPKGVPEWSEA